MAQRVGAGEGQGREGTWVSGRQVADCPGQPSAPRSPPPPGGPSSLVATCPRGRPAVLGLSNRFLSLRHHTRQVRSCLWPPELTFP